MRVECKFDRDIGDFISMELAKAKKSVQVAVAWLNDIDLIKKLKYLKNEGVKVEVIIYEDKLNSNVKELIWIRDSIRCINNIDSSYSTMHHKFCIIDNKVIISGSYNWTFRARNHNSENIVLIENEDAIKIFDEVFKSLWNQSIAYDFQKSYIKENEHDIDIDYSLESKYETEINNRTEEVKKLKIGIDINLIYGLINKRSARIAAITLTRNGNNIKIQSGFQKLWKEKKLYLSLEESIINSDFIQLFEKIDIARAYKKLKSMNYFDSEEYQKLMQRYDLENLSKIYEDMKTKV